MPLASINGTMINYVEQGSADATPLILSNSLGADLTMWDRQAGAFAAHFRLIRYDTRGHGHSSPTAGDYDIALLARDVLGLADHLGIDRFHFCGLSLGGMTGQWLAANTPERIIKLVLCCTFAWSGSPEIWQQRIDAVRVGGAGAVAAPSMERWFSEGFRKADPAEVAVRQNGIAATSAEGYMGCAAAIRDMDQREMVRSIAAPTLIVAGGIDPAATRAQAELLHEHIEGSRLETIDGAAHLANIEQPEKVTKLVLDFLRGD